MFRHKGKNRTYKHNLLLAALLSSNAGLVNITGVLSISVLTTNVTGHFAFFSEQLSLHHYDLAINFLVFIFSFLLGSFFSSILTEYFESKEKKTSHGLSMSIEIVLLFSVGYYLKFLQQLFFARSYSVCLIICNGYAKLIGDSNI